MATNETAARTKKGFGWTYLLGYDVFISYRQGDSATYAQNLFALLNSPGYDLTCFLDQEDTPGGDILSPVLERALRKSHLLVVILTPDIVGSQWMGQELEHFTKSSRPIIPISVDRILEGEILVSTKFAALRDRTWINETADSFRAGTPSPALAAQIKKARGKLSVRTISRSIIAVVLLVLTATAGIAIWNWRSAVIARNAAVRSRDEANAARIQEEVARKDAVAARDIAQQEKARAEQEALRTRAHAIALSADFARQSEPEVAALLLGELPTHEFGAQTQALATARRILSTAIPNTVLRGHKASISAASFDSTGHLLVSVSEDGTARAWNTATGQPLATLQESQSIVAAQFAQPGQIVTVALNGNLTWWDTKGARQRTISLGEHLTPRTWLTEDRVFWAVDNNHIKVRSLGPDSTTSELLSDTPVSFLAVSPDGKTITGRSGSGPVVVWQQPSGPGKHFSDYEASWLAFSPDSRRFAAVGTTGMQLWNVDGTNVARIVEERDILRGQVWRAVGFTKDNKYLLLSSQEGVVRVRNADESVKYRYSFGVSTGGLQRILFTPNGKYVATSGGDAMVRLWKWTDPDIQGWMLPQATTLVHPFWASALAFSPDGQRIATSSGTNIRVWNVETQPDPVVLNRSGESTSGEPQFDPTGSRIAVIAGDLSIWLSTGSLKSRFAVPTRRFVVARWSADGQLVALATRDGEIYVAVVEQDAQPRRIGQQAPGIMSMEFSKNNRELLTASKDGIARLWPVDQSRPPVEIGRAAPALNAAQFSADEQDILTASDNGTVRLISRLANTPKWENTDAAQAGHDRFSWPITSLHLNVTRTLIAVAGSNGRTFVISMRDGHTVASIVLGTQPLVDADFSADGGHLVVSSESGRVDTFDLNDVNHVTASVDLRRRLWRVRLSADRHNALAVTDSIAYLLRLDGSGEPLELPGNPDRISTQGEISANASHVVTVDAAGHPQLWRVGWDEILSSLAHSTSACLTAEQRIRYLAEAPNQAAAKQHACELSRFSK